MTERFSSAAPRFVRIVGAGPGPLDSMTLRVLYQLRNAAVVIRNRLDSTKVLDQILPQARRVYVGKAIGDRSVPQYGLHALLVAHSRIGSRVVRLKGGDSYVFGRDRDEIQALRVQSIAFEVVPGVTAPSGCGHSIDAPQPCRQLCVFTASFCARRCHVRLASFGAARVDASFLHGCAASGANCRAAVQPWVGTQHTGRCRARRQTPYTNGDRMQSAAFSTNTASLWSSTRLADFWRESVYEAAILCRLTC